MGKGRRLTISRSERFLGSYGSGYCHVDGGAAAAAADSELVEEEVWSVVDNDAAEQDERYPAGAWAPRSAKGSCECYSARGVAAPSWGWERKGRHVGGLTVAVEEDFARTSRTVHHFLRTNDGGGGGSAAARGGCVGGRRHMATSAPVNVPDWSKILGVGSVESLHGDSEADVAELELDGEMVPPHEWVARGRRDGGASVFVGVGRTLKGRDMRRVRDTVWSQTGFDG